MSTKGGLQTSPCEGIVLNMSALPKVKLSRLREISWSLWDPIGLRELSDGEWQDGGGCADEYDGYLLQVVGRLRRGDPAAEVAAYLEDTEVGHIGLTRSPSTSLRATATVEAIRDYLTTIEPGPLKVR